MDRLETEVKAKGLTVFARVDHAAGAAAVSMPLRPTEVLIFGNATGGTPLMEANQSAGINLPLKALVYQMRPERCGCPTTIRAGLRSGTGSVRPSPRMSKP
jgi:uncharacterized protein (DUF302 family)